MTAEPSHVQRHGVAIDPDGLHARQCELDGLRLAFPAYRIWREVMGDRVRLVAVSQWPGVSPHTVVTDDPAELRAALAGSASGNGLP